MNGAAQRCDTTYSTLRHYVKYTCTKTGLLVRAPTLAPHKTVQRASAGFSRALAPLHTRHEAGIGLGPKATGKGFTASRQCAEDREPPSELREDPSEGFFGLLVVSSVEDSPVYCGQIPRTGKVEFQQIAATRLLYWVQHFDSYPSRLQVIWQSSPKRT